MSIANTPAFPARETHSTDGTQQVKFHTGMTMRQYYAGEAMKGLLANSATTGSGTDVGPLVTGTAVFLADQLIAALERAS